MSRKIGRLLRITFWTICLIVLVLIGPNIAKNFIGYEDYAMGVYTNIVAGVAVTLAINEILRIRDDRQQLRRLVREMGGPSNDYALHAVRELSALGYLYDGTLSRKLPGVFGGSGFSKAKLERAELSFARLTGTNLSGVDLRFANLRKAHLEFTFLGEAHLEGANLESAYLASAEGLSTAHLSPATILPNGSYYVSPEETDLDRFTNPKHRDFYDPDSVNTRRAGPFYTPTL